MSTCNYIEPITNEIQLNELNLQIYNRSGNRLQQRVPHYKRQNSLTIETHWIV